MRWRMCLPIACGMHVCWGNYEGSHVQRYGLRDDLSRSL